jgi:hypothetical protein
MLTPWVIKFYRPWFYVFTGLGTNSCMALRRISVRFVLSLGFQGCARRRWRSRPTSAGSMTLSGKSLKFAACFSVCVCVAPCDARWIMLFPISLKNCIKESAQMCHANSISMCRLTVICTKLNKVGLSYKAVDTWQDVFLIKILYFVSYIFGFCE